MRHWHKPFIAALSCSIACLGTAYAQSSTAEYPNKPVKLVVPTGAGGGTDLAARAVSERLAGILGQPVIVENRAGAGGIIGIGEVARAAPDGYTFLISSNQFSMLPALNSKLPYDPIKDFAPIAPLGMIPTLVLVNPELPIHSVQELLEYGKKHPDNVQYATAGVGSPNHLFAAMFSSMAQLPMLHAPFKGSPPALVSVAGGQTALSFASKPAAQSFVDAGKLRAIAVTSAERLAALPDLPPVADAVPGYEADIWLGVWAPAGTPEPILERVHAALAEAVKDPAVAQRFDGMGLVTDMRSRKDFSAMVDAEIGKWQRVVADAGDEITKQ